MIVDARSKRLLPPPAEPVPDPIYSNPTMHSRRGVVAGRVNPLDSFCIFLPFFCARKAAWERAVFLVTREGKPHDQHLIVLWDQRPINVLLTRLPSSPYMH